MPPADQQLTDLAAKAREADHLAKALKKQLEQQAKGRQPKVSGLRPAGKAKSS